MDVHRLERWAHANLMKFNAAKCKILHLCCGNPNQRYRSGREWLESSPEEKDLGLLVDEQFNMSWQCVFAAQKTNLILGYIRAKYDQQVEGGDSAHLLCSHETPPGVLHLVLELPAQEGHEVVGAGP